MIVDHPEIQPLGRFEMYALNGLIQLMEPDTEMLMRERAERELIDDEFDSPHALAWFQSFHASMFPGDSIDACERLLVYRMMNIPPSEIMTPYVTTTGTLGKAGELDIADAWCKGGRMLGFPEGAEEWIEWERLPPRKVYPEGHKDAGKPLPIKQLGFSVPEVWLTASTDLPVLKEGWTKPYINELKCKADEVLQEMINGITKDGRRLDRLRGPDAPHVRQLKATISAAARWDWGVVAVCEHCWRIAGWSHYPELLNLDYQQEHPREPFPAPWSDSFYYCAWCKTYDPIFIDLDPPDCGEIYYWSRSWPRTTKSFFYELDNAFFDAGLEVLAHARAHFLADTIPPRPDHFQWSTGPCGQCRLKPSCRMDSGLLPKKRKPNPDLIETQLSSSNAVTYARSLRPHYDLEAIRQKVVETWS